MANAHCYNGNKKEAFALFEKAILRAEAIKDEEINIEKIKKNYEECKNR